MPKAIKSISDYQDVYKESVADPEAFWASVAEDFQWKKNGIRFLNGISTNPK